MKKNLVCFCICEVIFKILFNYFCMFSVIFFLKVFFININCITDDDFKFEDHAWFCYDVHVVDVVDSSFQLLVLSMMSGNNHHKLVFYKYTYNKKTKLWNCQSRMNLIELSCQFLFALVKPYHVVIPSVSFYMLHVIFEFHRH